MLKIRSGVILKDSLYVIVGGTDRLILIDISGDNWSVYDGIDLAVPHNSMTYWDLFYCNEKIYCIPNNGICLVSYDPIKKEVTHINMRFPKDLAAGIYGEKIYILPEKTSDKLFYYDITAEVLQEEVAWSVGLSKEKIQGTISRYYFSDENEIVFSLRESNGFFSYSINELKMFRHPTYLPVRDVAKSNGCYYYLANPKEKGIIGKIDQRGIARSVYEKEKQYAKHFIKYRGSILAEIGTNLIIVDDTARIFSEGVCDNTESSNYICAADCSNRSILLPWSQDSFADISNARQIVIHSVDFLSDSGTHLRVFRESKSYALKEFLKSISDV